VGGPSPRLWHSPWLSFMPLNLHISVRDLSVQVLGSMKAHKSTRTSSWTVVIGFACTDSDNEESEGSEDCREAHIVNRVKTWLR
jgi:hypothetical protein